VVYGGGGCQSYTCAYVSSFRVGERETDHRRYHYPGVSNNILAPPALFERLAEHKNIVGCKLSHGDLPILTQITMSTSAHTAPDKFRVFTGLGQQLVPVLSVGGAGAIDGLAGFFPHVVVRLYNVFQELQAAGDSKHHLRQALRDLQGDVTRGEELVGKWGTVGIKEAIARELGLGSGPATRLPLYGGLTEAQWQEFEPVMAQLRKVEKMLQEHRTNVERKE
jgi:2-keto-3-deoxy-L-rhamnonate aldolase